MPHLKGIDASKASQRAGSPTFAYKGANPIVIHCAVKTYPVGYLVGGRVCRYLLWQRCHVAKLPQQSMKKKKKLKAKSKKGLSEL